MGVLADRRVAVKCNDRGLRSCYRAAAHASVVHDSSYLAVLEIRAESKLIIKQILKKRLSLEDGRRATTDPVTEGTRRVKTLVLLAEDGQAVGPVDLLWRPGDVAHVWIWVLPPLKEQVEELLASRFPAEAEQLCKVSTLSPPPLCFSLFGPRSGTVLAALLDPLPGCPKELRFITQVRSPACLPASCVFAGYATDPRRTFPPKKMGKHYNDIKVFDEEMQGTFRSVQDSELWSEERRQFWSEFIPSKETDIRNIAPAKVPFMLLQTDFGTPRGFASGWDLIVPAGWGMPFWISLMYANGNRAIGQEELLAMRLETGQFVFPEDFADTVSGRAMLRDEEKRLKEAFLRRPKSKRVNYTLNRIESPMYPALRLIARAEAIKQRRDKTTAPPQKKPRGKELAACPDDVDVDESDIRIIRSQQLMQSSLGEVWNVLIRSSSRQHNHRHGYRSPHSSPNLDSVHHDNSLFTDCVSFLRVSITLPGKGVPTKNGLICAPAKADLPALRGMGKGRNGFGGFREMLARNGEGKPTRLLIGFVTLGGFSLTQGAGVANGIIAVSAIKRLVQQNGTFQESSHRDKVPSIAVLIRNTSSLQYRPACIRLVS